MQAPVASGQTLLYGNATPCQQFIQGMLAHPSRATNLVSKASFGLDRGNLRHNRGDMREFLIAVEIGATLFFRINGLFNYLHEWDFVILWLFTKTS
jgi:hypothetical protein